MPPGRYHSVDILREVADEADFVGTQKPRKLNLGFTIDHLSVVDEFGDRDQALDVGREI